MYVHVQHPVGKVNIIIIILASLGLRAGVRERIMAKKFGIIRSRALLETPGGVSPSYTRCCSVGGVVVSFALLGARVEVGCRRFLGAGL